METIEQLRNDTRPLVSLGKASVATCEPLGNLLIQLADKDIPLFLKRPEGALIFCITPSPSIAFRKRKYPESIILYSRAQDPTGFIEPKRGDTHIDATHFEYLVLSSHDYHPLTESDSPLPIKLFSQVAYIEKSNIRPVTVEATEYYRRNLPRKNPINLPHLNNLEDKFACYFTNDEWPSVLNLTTVIINPEELLVSRAALLENVIDGNQQNSTFPLEIQEHLQLWKSELLLALNKAAFIFFSNNKDIKDVSNHRIIEAIKEQINGRKPSETTLNRVATILRQDRQPTNFKHAVNIESARKYPKYFTPQLIYLNIKCEEYYDACHDSERQKLPTATEIKYDLQHDRVINSDTAVRIASSLIPILLKPTR